MKHLNSEETHEKIREAQERVKVLKATRSEEEALNDKMKLLESKLFGIFSPVRYTLMSTRRVLIPMEILVFHYEIIRNLNSQPTGKKGYFDRSGEIAVVYDLNEEHAFHFDLADALQMDEIYPAGQYTVLPDKCSDTEVMAGCLEIVRWKMLNRVFRTSGEVRPVRRQKFYRQAVEMKVESRGKIFRKYAYLDGFTNKNEHISGLKVRLDV